MRTRRRQGTPKPNRRRGDGIEPSPTGGESIETAAPAAGAEGELRGEENPRRRRSMPAAALLALGIVYGDLGTSPLYTLPAVSEALGGKLSPETGLGVLSLIFWALIIVVSIKYCLFVMRADNHGEGGILALMSLVAGRGLGRALPLIVMGLVGAALLYGDGVITPAISVMSAVEGVSITSHALRPYEMPISVAILFALFAVQNRGTARLGVAFGPVMLLWFLVVGALGIGGIWRHPAVLLAIDPGHAFRFLLHSGWRGFATLGGVFLALTGAEALYADMGHIGRNPIRLSWYLIVLPACVLNYAGQVALMIEHPGAQSSLFFRLAPNWAVIPLVVLATMATIIASQAIITGAGSLTRQAMQLGWLPGLHIRQTSDTEYGQIYVPLVNWLMMIATIALTILFRNSDRLAGAYGTAVSTTMLMTTALLYTMMRTRWRWPWPVAALVGGVFLVVDLVFFGANLLKIADGGWVPLTLGAIIFAIMVTWHAGLAAMQRQQTANAATLGQFRARLRNRSGARVPGTAIFLTRLTEKIPPQIVEHLNQFGALPETVIALTVSFEIEPRIAREKRLDLVEMFPGFWEMTVHYGFVEVPNLPRALRDAKARGCPVDFSKAIYIGTRDQVIRARSRPRLARWQLPIFAFLLRNAVHIVDLFRLPPRNYVEISRLCEV